MEIKPEPNWQPICNLPMIAQLIDGQLADAKKQYSTLLNACPKPHVLDDYTVQRVIHVYTEQLEFVGVFEQQLFKWLKKNV